MLTHITLELPRVLETAGIPIVRLPIQHRSLLYVCTLSRTSTGNLYSATPWADMVHSLCISLPKPINTNPLRPLPPFQTQACPHGAKRHSPASCKGAWKKESYYMTLQSSSRGVQERCIFLLIMCIFFGPPLLPSLIQ